ncbi:MAG: ThiF family adenylyltransferase [Clostridia bacterium]|nr:ThiF family adenylyltransferase [Clostridia bacterium]
MSPDPFSRTRLLLGDAGMARLAAARVAVFGLGGVGGSAVEALARSGVGALDLFDDDTVSLTNLNRQAVATVDTLGMAKVDAMAARVAAVAPAARVERHQMFYMPENAGEVDLAVYDYVVDAVDTVAAKLELAVRATSLGVPIISAMGAGNKLDPTRLVISDIYKTSVCPLARVMRRELRRRGVRRLKVAWSTEPPAVPMGEPAEEAGLHPRRSIPGSTAFVPPAMGLAIAAEVVRELVGE